VNALRARTWQGRVNASNHLLNLQAQLQRAMAQLQTGGGKGVPPGYKMSTTKTSYDLQATENVKVRTMLTGDGFDEKGNPVKPTKAQLAAMKGKDKNLVGYEATLEKLEVGQKVRVTLVRAPVKPATAKEKDKDIDGAAKDEKKMQVKMIVILSEANADAVKGKPKGKKAK